MMNLNDYLINPYSSILSFSYPISNFITLILGIVYGDDVLCIKPFNSSDYLSYYSGDGERNYSCLIKVTSFIFISNHSFISSQLSYMFPFLYVLSFKFIGMIIDLVSLKQLQLFINDFLSRQHYSSDHQNFPYLQNCSIY